MTIVVVLAMIGTCYANVGPDSYVRAKDDAILLPLTLFGFAFHWWPPLQCHNRGVWLLV